MTVVKTQVVTLEHFGTPQKSSHQQWKSPHGFKRNLSQIISTILKRQNSACSKGSTTNHSLLCFAGSS